MKIQKIALLAALAAMSSGAFAGAFDGPFFQMGMGIANTKVKLADPSLVVNGADLSNTSAIGLIGGGVFQIIRSVQSGRYCLLEFCGLQGKFEDSDGWCDFRGCPFQRYR